jgi:cellulose biosynthesis protein BcsQ
VVVAPGEAGHFPDIGGRIPDAYDVVVMDSGDDYEALAEAVGATRARVVVLMEGSADDLSRLPAFVEALEAGSTNRA